MSNNLVIQEAQSDFALSILKDSIAKTPASSVIISPISVAIALSMVYAGSGGQTEKELARVLANVDPEKKKDVHDYFGTLLQKMSNGQKNYTLEVANKVFMQNGFDMLKSYIDLLNQNYLGRFESVNFGEGTSAAKTINDFVKEKTHEKIQDLISPNALDTMTRLVLVNAIYFKGSWASKFDASLTKKQPFYINENDHKEVDMMKKKAKYLYADNEDLGMQVLGLPYQGDDVSMFVLLPKKRAGLNELLEKLNGKNLLELVKNVHKSEVIVSLPKFKIESTHQLVDTLKKLGLPSAFGDAADFSGISAKEGLKISDVVQKAFIEVNEEGTTAAAATGAVLELRSMVYHPEFEADHPFAFFLVSNNKDLLFAGRYTQ